MFNFFKKNKEEIKIETKNENSNISNDLKYVIEHSVNLFHYDKYIKNIIEGVVENVFAKRLFNDKVAKTSTISLDELHELLDTIINNVNVNIPVGLQEVINFLYTPLQIKYLCNEKLTEYVMNNYKVYDNNKNK